MNSMKTAAASLPSRPVLEPSESLSYGRFEEIMQEVDDMLGGGSSYALIRSEITALSLRPMKMR